MQRMEAQVAVNVSDLKKSPTGIMARADGEAVAEIIRERAHEEPVRVSLDEL